MSFFTQYPGIRIATKDDSKKILDFYDNIPMDTTDVLLQYIREPNFFSFLEYQGSEVFVFLLENKANQIAAVGTLTIREGYVKGKLVRIGYLSDLRVHLKRLEKGILRTWKRFYGDLVENSKELPETRCDYLITAIMASNKIAKRSLVNQSKNSFHYEKLCDYKMINILTSLGNINRSPKFKVRRCHDMSEVLDYLEEKYIKRQFGFTRKFIQNAIIHWDGLNLSNFIKVEVENKIVGMCATWNPSSVKKIIFKRLPMRLKFLNFIASFLTKTPKEGHELEIQYMNFLVVEDDHALGAMIDFLKMEGLFKKFHLLAFADFNHKSYFKDKIGVMCDKTELELYQVVSKKHMNEMIKLEDIPGFEISLV